MSQATRTRRSSHIDMNRLKTSAKLRADQQDADAERWTEIANKDDARHTKSLETLDELLTWPGLPEADRVLAAGLRAWVAERPTRYIGSTFSRHFRALTWRKRACERGRMSLPAHSTEADVARATSTLRTFIHEAEVRRAAYESRLAPFMRDPSLLPKRPLTHKRTEDD